MNLSPRRFFLQNRNDSSLVPGEATYLVRKATASATVPAGWPPLGETLEKIVAEHIPVFA